MHAYARAALAAQPNVEAAAYLIRSDFETRMRAEGHSTSALSWLIEGMYLSPTVQREWEAEKRKLIAAPAQPAEPMAWPAGWFESPHGAFRANPYVKLKFPSELLGWQIPLYTHPPQTALTDEQIIRLMPQYPPSGAEMVAFARAVLLAAGGAK
jgi:hypothetical protein